MFIFLADVNVCWYKIFLVTLVLCELFLQLNCKLWEITSLRVRVSTWKIVPSAFLQGGRTFEELTEQNVSSCSNGRKYFVLFTQRVGISKNSRVRQPTYV